MNDFLKFALIGAGGWMLYQKFFGASSVAAAAPPAAATPSSTSLVGSASTTPAPQAVAIAQSSTTRDMLLAAARKSFGATWDGLANADEWNYFYQQTRGINGPDPTQVWPNRDRGFRMSIDEYWTSVSGAGFTGLSGYALLRPWVAYV